jgi:hypothetical protein
MSGRRALRSCAMADENSPGLRSTSSTPAREVTTTPTPSTRSTGDPSRSAA